MMRSRFIEIATKSRPISAPATPPTMTKRSCHGSRSYGDRSMPAILLECFGYHEVEISARRVCHHRSAAAVREGRPCPERCGRRWSVGPLQKGVEPVEGGAPAEAAGRRVRGVSQPLLVLCSTLDEPSRLLLTLDNPPRKTTILRHARVGCP